MIINTKIYLLLSKYTFSLSLDKYKKYYELRCHFNTVIGSFQ